ncbi:MAG TPA: hypothetical protein VG738_17085 [Chitinophagaceae bacterium]|nr:hypothetical protein [Chitinophagaceae bacterium]
MDTSEIMQAGKFTKAQQDLLKMFSASIPDADWEAIRDFAKHYFAKKATGEMDKLFAENEWGDEKIAEWTNTHLRTSYSK